MRKRVIVLGASGMLGSMIVDALARDSDLELTATVRDEATAERCRATLPNVDWQLLDADDPERLAVVDGQEWIVNAIGIIKPLITDDDSAKVQRAIRINGLFPHRLAERAAISGGRVLQIATDCVYSGSKGSYVESDAHDALDVYGKTKSLGETTAPGAHHLRCSIIGPESGASRSLLEWFLGQPDGAELNGFVNHQWNGVTTLHFARLCGGAIRSGLDLPTLQHVVPRGRVSKYELLRSFAREYERPDLTISPTEAPTAVDRTVETGNEPKNRELWAAAGYDTPPTVPDMVAELARYDYRFGPAAVSAGS
ncbi:MAG: dTDP-4-dehydrorhamnose reductase family protein [Gaiellaceae bacterium]